MHVIPVWWSQLSYCAIYLFIHHLFFCGGGGGGGGFTDSAWPHGYFTTVFTLCARPPKVLRLVHPSTSARASTQNNPPHRSWATIDSVVRRLIATIREDSKPPGKALFNSVLCLSCVLSSIFVPVYSTINVTWRVWSMRLFTSCTLSVFQNYMKPCVIKGHVCHFVWHIPQIRVSRRWMAHVYCVWYMWVIIGSTSGLFY